LLYTDGKKNAHRPYKFTLIPVKPSPVPFMTGCLFSAQRWIRYPTLLFINGRVLTVQFALACIKTSIDKGLKRHIFLPGNTQGRAQYQRKGNILPAPFIGETIVMAGVNQVFGINKGFPLLYGSGSGGMDRQNLPYRIFPQGKDVLPRKGQIIGMFPP
jgi:hypothetical protein